MENDLGRIMSGERIRTSAALSAELQRDFANLIVFETQMIVTIIRHPPLRRERDAGVLFTVDSLFPQLSRNGHPFRYHQVRRHLFPIR